MKKEFIAVLVIAGMSQAGTCWTVATGFNSLPAPQGLIIRPNGEYIAYWNPTSVQLAGTGCSGNPTKNYGSSWGVSGSLITPGGNAIFEALKDAYVYGKRINLAIDLSVTGISGLTPVQEATLTQ